MQSIASVRSDPAFTGLIATMVLKAQEEEACLSARSKPHVIGVGTASLRKAGELAPPQVRASRVAAQERRETQAEATAEVVARTVSSGKPVLAKAIITPAKRSKAAKAPKHLEPFQDSRGMWREANGRMMSKERQAATGYFNPAARAGAEERATAYAEAGFSEAGAGEQADRDTRAILRGAKAPKDRAPSTLKLGKNGLWYYGSVVKGSKKGMSRGQVVAILAGRGVVIE